MENGQNPGADQGFFLGGGTLVSYSTSTPINNIVFFFLLQNTSCIRKPHVISGRGGGGGGAHPLHPPPRSAPESKFPFAGLYQLLNGFSFGTDDNQLKVQFVVLYTVCK